MADKHLMAYSKRPLKTPSQNATATGCMLYSTALEGFLKPVRHFLVARIGYLARLESSLSHRSIMYRGSTVAHLLQTQRQHLACCKLGLPPFTTKLELSFTLVALCPDLTKVLYFAAYNRDFARLESSLSPLLYDVLRCHSRHIAPDAATFRLL